MGENVNISVSQQIQGVTIVAGQPGSGGGTGQILLFVYGETPAGVLNGVNATFTSAYEFVPESVEVFLNGLKLKVVEEYNTTGNNTITLSISPGASERILINYLKL